MDVTQVSNKLIHLAFQKQGGNFHIVGAHAPHSGSDYEADRLQFWESLEKHLEQVPQPEPIYVTGDFNVRFQAVHKNDQGVWDHTCLARDPGTLTTPLAPIDHYVLKPYKPSIR